MKCDDNILIIKQSYLRNSWRKNCTAVAKNPEDCTKPIKNAKNLIK